MCALGKIESPALSDISLRPSVDSVVEDSKRYTAAAVALMRSSPTLAQADADLPRVREALSACTTIDVSHMDAPEGMLATLCVFPNATSLDMKMIDGLDVSAEEITRLPNITAVDCDETGVSTTQLNNIVQLAGLTSLNASHNKDAFKGGVDIAKATKLQRLVLADCGLEARDLDGICTLSATLRVLHVPGNPWVFSGPQQATAPPALQTLLAGLTELDVSGCDLRDLVTQHITTHGTALQTLKVARSSVGDVIAPALHNLKQLTHLDVSGTSMGTHAFEKVAQCALTQLNISDNTGLGEQGIATRGVRRMKSWVGRRTPGFRVAGLADTVETLWASNINMGKEIVAELQGMKRLHTLDMSSNAGVVPTVMADGFVFGAQLEATLQTLVMRSLDVTTLPPALLRLGALCSLDVSQCDRIDWGRAEATLAELAKKVKTLRLADTRLTQGALMAVLAGSVKELDVSSNKIGAMVERDDVTFDAVGDTLTGLNMQQTGLTRQGLVKLCGSLRRLETLNILYTDVGIEELLDADLKDVAHTLRELKVTRGTASDEQCSALARKLPLAHIVLAGE